MRIRTRALSGVFFVPVENLNYDDLAVPAARRPHRYGPLRLRTGPQLKLLTVGSTDEITALAAELGANDARQQLREQMAGDAKVEHYASLRAEADGIDQECGNWPPRFTGRWPSARSVLPSRPPASPAAWPSWIRRPQTYAPDSPNDQPADAHMRAPWAAPKQKRRVLAVLQTAAGDVRARVAWDVQNLRRLTVERITEGSGAAAFRVGGRRPAYA